MSPSSLLLRLELRSDPEMLRVVRNALGELAEKLGFSEEEGRAVVLAVDEAMTNIIRHAYSGERDKPIHATFHRIDDGQKGEALEIVLEDDGKKADPEKFCGRPLEDVRPGGLGLHFIRECMDTVEFSQNNGRNRLRLVKRLKVRKPQIGS